MFDFFGPFAFILTAHAVYYFTGNWMIFLFAMHAKIVVSHFLFGDKVKDNRNISRKSEKLFYKDNRFMIPLYLCHFAETATWIWALCVVSDKVKWDSYYMTAIKPQTTWHYISFVMVVGFCSAVNTSGGHELCH